LKAAARAYIYAAAPGAIDRARDIFA
jgi:hypothetical protein